MRKSIRASLCALTVCSFCLVAASGASAAPQPAPCHRAPSGHYDCSFWPAGNGLSAGAVVVSDSGYWVGYLNHGTNWVSCQAYGGRVNHGPYYNHYWAWTEANNHHWGWVNAVWASGGANDGKFGGVPYCDPQRDVGPPGQLSSGPAAPRPRPPAPATPLPAPCRRAASGHYDCSFWPAGNGLSAGAVVVSDSGYWVGYLNHGTNWVSCQAYGGRVNHGPYYNHYWAWTEANNHHWGWVNAVWASGGANDGKFGGVPYCDPQRDVGPPGQLSSRPGAPKPKPKPKPPAPRPKNMVVLGDSYSSGEGAPLYEKTCFRSHDAYGYLVARDLGYRLTGFEACGGATTNSVQSYQLGALSSATTLVTMSVGGNDADFIGVVGRCAALGLETACKNMIKKEEGFMRTTLPGRLDTTYSEIHSRAPHARVVILGYPNLWGSCAGNVAGLHYLPAPTAMMDSTLAAAARRHGFTFVDPRSAFTGHSICDKSGWINGLRTHELWQSFHPNPSGYRADASLIEAALR